MHIINKLDVASSLQNIATSEHSLLRTDHNFWRQTSHLSEQPRVIYEAWDIASNKPVHHAAYADDFAGKDTGVDRRFRIVAHDAAKKLHVRGRFTKRVIHVDHAVSILQIAITSAST